MTNDFAAQSVLARLSWGRDNAQSLSQIAQDLDCPRRAVEKAVQELRLAGRPIASSGEGCWLTSDAGEMEATYRALRGRIESQKRTSWAVRATYRRMRAATYHQETLFDAA